MTGELIHKKENIYHRDVQRSIKFLNDFETTSSIADELRSIWKCNRTGYSIETAIIWNGTETTISSIAEEHTSISNCSLTDYSSETAII